jgi:hypothetical protein
VVLLGQTKAIAMAVRKCLGPKAMVEAQRVVIVRWRSQADARNKQIDPMRIRMDGFNGSAISLADFRGLAAMSKEPKVGSKP